MQDTAFAAENNPIDVVITWVDGNDPKFLEKFNPCLQGLPRSAIPGAHHTRFSSSHEIRYCVLSILQFAPFVRNIFIVTDGQEPQLTDHIKLHFPNRTDTIRVVDHKEIFFGYEQYLPTFSSRTIESMIWRIPGLSNNFVYFNDDFFLVRDIKPEDWFVNGKPVLQGKWVPAPYPRIMWDFVKLFINKYLLQKSSYQVRPSFHIGQWNSAHILGYKLRYFANSHTPSTIETKTIEKFFTQNSAILEKNISYQFRNRKQLNPISLSNHLQLQKGNSNISRPRLVYINAHKKKKGYIDAKIRQCQANPKIKYLCIQSLELCNQHDQEKLFAWLDQQLGFTPRAAGNAK
ncbi:MAG: Stealth CR1 domain-containing protein [Tenuifilaceae bacterium]|jgi:hypothetical protein|nr:Stealth CR1 domain-containing protein [Tenuifilaceae bacterium]